jgi:hypothetical protein
MTTSSKQQAAGAGAAAAAASSSGSIAAAAAAAASGRREAAESGKAPIIVALSLGRAFVVAGAHHEKLRQECLKHEPTFGSLPVPWLFCSARDALHCAAAAAAEAIESASKRKLREILSVIL